MFHLGSVKSKKKKATKELFPLIFVQKISFRFDLTEWANMQATEKRKHFIYYVEVLTWRKYFSFSQRLMFLQLWQTLS
jgi:hypothetical protein